MEARGRRWQVTLLLVRRVAPLDIGLLPSARLLSALLLPKLEALQGGGPPSRLLAEAAAVAAAANGAALEAGALRPLLAGAQPLAAGQAELLSRLAQQGLQPPQQARAPPAAPGGSGARGGRVVSSPETQDGG